MIRNEAATAKPNMLGGTVWLTAALTVCIAGLDWIAPVGLLFDFEAGPPYFTGALLGLTLAAAEEVEAEDDVLAVALYVEVVGKYSPLAEEAAEEAAEVAFDRVEETSAFLLEAYDATGALGATDTCDVGATGACT